MINITVGNNILLNMSEEIYKPEEQQHIDYGAPIDPSLAQWLLDPQKALERLRERLRGNRIVIRNNQAVVVKVKGAKPLMNERGTLLFCDLMLGTISETLVTISNFDENTECNMSLDVMNTMTISLWVAPDEYGIETDENAEPNLAVLEIIKASTRPFVRAVMRQAYNEGARNFLKKWTKELYSHGKGGKGFGLT